MNKKGIKPTVAVVMITFNEEFHIGAAIDNVKEVADEIFILDSLSTDRTVDIALSKGCFVLQRPFTNFGDQWNFALANLPIRSNYTMKMDPDERLTPELIKSIEKNLILGEANYYSLYRRLWFMGKPINIKQKIDRIWKSGMCTFSNVAVNENIIVEGKNILLDGYLDHLDSRDLFYWSQKQNTYTTMEAMALLQKEDRDKSRNFRTFIKYNIYKFPFCFTLLYFYNLVIKGAWRSGKEGRAWAKLRTHVYRMRWYKYLEMRTVGSISPIPPNKSGDYNERVLSNHCQQRIMKQSNFKL